MKLQLRGSTAYPAMVLVAIATVLASACAAETRIVDLGDAPPTDQQPGNEGIFAPPPDASEDGGASRPDPEKVLACIATECPYPYDTCPSVNSPLPYKCGTNVLTDNANCGACGTVCSHLPNNLAERCIDGTCQPTCAYPTIYRDCNDNLVDDGCETNIASDPENCGGCGNKCPQITNGVRSCISGVCAQDCLSPRTWCAAQRVCTDLSSDNSNCGACGSRCPFQASSVYGTLYSCADGVCNSHLVCQARYANCNDDMSDGCEVLLTTDPKNCGECGNVCPPGQVCLGGSNPKCGCEPGQTLCGGGSAQLYCADLLSDALNCGACMNACPRGNNETAVCNNGVCGTKCDLGFADCDGDGRNGCEADLNINPRHCGACGNQCDIAAGQPCIDGQCLTVECDGGTVTK